MKVLLKKVVLIHPGHRFHNSSVNILISNGKLEKITKGNIKAESYKKIEGGYVSGGWFDIGTHAGSPGFEHRETSTSLIDSANAGGFTHVAPMPNLNPVSDNQTNIQFLKNQTQNQSIQICPIGSVTQGNKFQISIDVLNIGNLLNSAWGVRQRATNTGLAQPIAVNIADGSPVYTFDTAVTQTFFNDFGLNSRWQAQVGLRYIFK